MTLWLPTDLGSKLLLWIDPTDATKVTASGGTISQIDDKSGNANNATASGSAKPATATDPDGSGLTVISNSVGTGLTLPSTILSGKTKATVYAMGRRTDPSGNGEYSQGPLIGNLTDTGHQVFHWPYAGTIYDGFCSTSRKTVGSFPSYAAWHLFSVHSEASLYEFRIDTGDGAGGSSAFYTDTGNTFNAGAAGTPFIGADNTPGASTYSWLGLIGPLVITDGTETTGERAQIEGYEAWRMGQQAVLPSGHTYHGAAPTTGGGGTDGNASGSTVSVTGSVSTSGAATGGAAKAGATITVTESVVQGAATGSASKAGATVTATSSVVAGTATGSATNAGATVTATSSVATSGTAAGTGAGAAAGAVIPVTTSVIAGAASATNPDASVPGVTISLAVSILSGAASGRSRDTGGSGNKKAGRARPHHASIITEEEHRQRQHDAALVLLLAA